jgi:hypothetical protein
VTLDWWPLSDGDPVPGDPETLAALGKHMTDAAAEIERMAVTLPRICTSETWDSDAGEQFRVKAASTAQGIGRTHRRFFTVARALGTSTYGGNGYAAQLQEHQDQAAAALAVVNGTTGTSGSEAQRLHAWAGLLTATKGADPTQPLAPPGTTGGASVLAALSRPAGAMPQASPGVVPPYLPAFPDDPADVTTLKNTYNDAIDQLSAAGRSVASAVSGQAADAGAAARMILTAIDNDGLNNPSGFMHWFDSTVADLANIAGAIATVCGIIALVLAFIPGLEEFAALFETVALLAQALAFCCHLLLFATGHGSLFEVIMDTVGLITFGVGKGLIGGAEATAEISETASSAYQSVVREGAGSVGSLIKASDNAVESLGAAEKWTIMSKAMEQMKEVVSIRPVFRNAMKAWQDGKFGATLSKSAVGTLFRGAESAADMSSPEISSALSKAMEAGDAMPYAKGVTWALTTQIECYQGQFRATQITGLLLDGIGKADAGSTYFSDKHLPVVGYLESALPHSKDS